MELNLFSKKIILSEIDPGQAECNFLNSNETFCDELWIEFSPDFRKPFPQIPEKIIAVAFVKLSVPQNFQMDTRKAILTDVPKNNSKLRIEFCWKSKNKLFFEIEKFYLIKLLWKLKNRFWPHRLNFLSIAQFCWLKICKKLVEMTFLEEKYFEDFFQYSRRKIWEHWKKFFFKSSRNYWSNYKSNYISFHRKPYILKNFSEKLASVYDNTAERFP